MDYCKDQKSVVSASILNLVLEIQVRQWLYYFPFII